MNNKYLLSAILVILAIIGGWYFFFSARTQNAQQGSAKQTSGDCIHEKDLSEDCMKEIILTQKSGNFFYEQLQGLEKNDISIVRKNFSSDKNYVELLYSFFSNVEKEQISAGATLYRTDELGWHF